MRIFKSLYTIFFQFLTGKRGEEKIIRFCAHFILIAYITMSILYLYNLTVFLLGLDPDRYGLDWMGISDHIDVIMHPIAFIILFFVAKALIRIHPRL